MDERHLPIRALMGMGVDLRGFAVRRPTGMPDAAISRKSRRKGKEILKPAFRLDDVNTVGLHGDSCGIVTAVFEFFKPVQKNGRRLPFACISNDSAHKKSSRFQYMKRRKSSCIPNLGINRPFVAVSSEFFTLTVRYASSPRQNGIRKALCI